MAGAGENGSGGEGMKHDARFWTLVGLVAVGVALRLVPHPPNFTPIGAIALFGGAHLASRRAAYLVPLAAMALSDLFLGLHWGMPVVYLAFALTVAVGRRLGPDPGAAPVAAGTLAGSLLFFLVTNLGVWAFGTTYPKTLAGLAACFTAAIPFFQNTLAGNAFWGLALFGGFALLRMRWPALRAESAGPG